MLGFIESSHELLHKRGYRLTPQRYLIIYVLEEAQGHLSIEEIVECVQQRNPCVSQSTVYRTLELLREVGLVRENHFLGEAATYEAVDGNAHEHLVCRGCHTVLHFDPALPANLREQLEQQYAYRALKLDLVAVGYCDACWKSSSAT
jgi:Fur family ferric uptake transcriptional regulator